MMTREQYILTKVAEEAVELAQRALKAVHFGLSEVQPGQASSNTVRLQEEFYDLCGVLDMVGLYDVDEAAMDNKRKKVEHYMNLSRSLGTLEEE